MLMSKTTYCSQLAPADSDGNHRIFFMEKEVNFIASSFSMLQTHCRYLAMSGMHHMQYNSTIDRVLRY